MFLLLLSIQGFKSYILLFPLNVCDTKAQRFQLKSVGKASYVGNVKHTMLMSNVQRICVIYPFYNIVILASVQSLHCCLLLVIKDFLHDHMKHVSNIID